MRRKGRPILRRVGPGVLGVLPDIDNKNKYFDELLGYLMPFSIGKFLLQIFQNPSIPLVDFSTDQ